MSSEAIFLDTSGAIGLETSEATLATAALRRLQIKPGQWRPRQAAALRRPARSRHIKFDARECRITSEATLLPRRFAGVSYQRRAGKPPLVVLLILPAAGR